MYTSVHTSAAVPIMLIFPNWVGVVLCVASHYALDTFAEADTYTDIQHTVMIDFVVLSGSVCIVALNHPNAWWFALGIFGANFPDIFDKIRDKVFKLPQILACHQDYWPRYWTPTPQQTLQVNIISFLTAIALMSLF